MFKVTEFTVVYSPMQGLIHSPECSTFINLVVFTVVVSPVATISIDVDVTSGGSALVQVDVTHCAHVHEITAVYFIGFSFAEILQWNPVYGCAYVHFILHVICQKSGCRSGGQSHAVSLWQYIPEMIP